MSGILIANDIPGRLIKIEIMGRDGGKFSNIEEQELTTGEFHRIVLPENGMVQIIVKDD